MRKGEKALFTLPPELAFGATGSDGVPPNAATLFEVELISWITVVDVCKDGGIIKRIMEKGDLTGITGPPGDLDEVLVRYTAMTFDGAIVSKTAEEGVEFYIKDGHFCKALPKAIKTMKRGERVNLIVQPQYAFGDRDKDSTSGFPLVPPDSVLSIDLELVSFKPVIDVTGNLGVLKKILKEGEGAHTANEGAAVSIRYSGLLEDGTLFEKKGLDGGKPLEFTTDEEQVVSGLDRAVTTMKKGELAIVTVKPDYGFGSDEVKCDFATVPPFSTIVFEVEMLDFKREKAPWEISSHERIEVASRKKEEGNALFKIGKYQRALKRYDKAVDFVSEDGPFGDDDQNMIKSLRVSCWLNGAACCLKLDDFEGAIKQCSMVLSIEWSNVKALYRRAQAYMKTNDLHLAELDIKRSLEIDPQNREVKLMQKNLKQLQVESNKRDANLYTTMFARMLNENSPATKRLKAGTNEDKTEDDIMAMEVDKDPVNSNPTPPRE
ncbi:peptidyl-prolyl cis-trans isomerase FKBP62-like isoform X2 [Ipomoea triloba]|nr:peptidyl-prolyl cis-trans isomerase FKBP62-like isoform X2 [Ipomoea triloba]XP_031118616.1 peptidyl-prolyl cis-trans isomerase FKBP62-like isoform X2 [Ipomoea triloba]